MGISSDGVLAFGFPVGGEDEAPEWLLNTDGKEVGFEEYACGEWDFENVPYAQRAKDLAACPADLVLFCSYEYPMYLLVVRGTTLTAARGDCVDVDDFEVSAEKISAFRTWCEGRGIEWQEPKWRLVSMYG